MDTETVRCAAFLDKGGVGKTTTTAHLGVALSEQGHDVLLVDLAGKQGDLAKHFGLWEEIRTRDDDWPNVTTVFQDEWGAIVEKLPSAVDDLIEPTGEGPDLIPAHESLDGLNDILSGVDDTSERYARLDRFLSEYIDPRYDVVFLDLPGSASNVAYNGLWAAGNVLASVRPGPFEAEQAAQLRRDIEMIRENQGIDIELTMVVLNEVDERTKVGRRYLEQFESEYPEAIAPSQIVSSQDIQNAQLNGCTLFELEKPSSTATRAIDAYHQNAEALVAAIEEGR
jgi:chromosome partitioning protein